MELYEIKEQFLRLADTDMDDITLQDTLEGLQGDLEDKVDNIACLVKSLNAEALAIKNEIENLAARATQKQSKADKLKSYVYATLKSLDIGKIETARNVLRIKKNPASVMLEEAFYIEEYMVEKVSYAPDKTKIKEDLNSGVIIKGARLEHKERLDIK